MATLQIDFNREQSKYEMKLSDNGSAYYDNLIVRRYGTKTRIIATGWAKQFPGPFLDYGCGTGQVSSCLVKQNCDVFAFDISANSIKINLKKNKIHAVVADLFAIPFKDKSFRTTCINGVMHHIIDLETAFDEVVRITGEFICMSELCVKRYYPRWVLLQDFVNTCAYIIRRIIGHTRTPSLSSKYERGLEPELLIKLLEERGFSVIKKKFYTNIDFLSDGLLKTMLTKRLISKKKERTLKFAQDVYKIDMVHSRAIIK